MNEEIILRNNSLINIGDTYIVVSFSSDDEISIQDSSIYIKVFNTNTKTEQLYKIFYIRCFKPSMVRIGRSPNCELMVNDTSLSRFHCYLEYKINIGWIIQDGVFFRNEKSMVEYRPSTNGTW